MATLSQLDLIRYASAQFVHGDRATCHKCGLHIFFHAIKRDDWGRGGQIRGLWLEKLLYPEPIHYFDPDAGEVLAAMRTDDACHHLPKEFCGVERANEYHLYCGKNVPYENIAAELYACGHHKAKAQQEKDDRERRRKREEQDAKENEVALYEIDQYERAAQWLRDNGYEDLLVVYGGRNNDSVVKRYEAKASRSWAGRNYVNRSFDIDVFRLYEILRDKKEGVDDGVVQSGEADPWREHAGDVPVQS